MGFFYVYNQKIIKVSLFFLKKNISFITLFMNWHIYWLNTRKTTLYNL